MISKQLWQLLPFSSSIVYFFNNYWSCKGYTTWGQNLHFRKFVRPPGGSAPFVEKAGLYLFFGFGFCFSFFFWWVCFCFCFLFFVCFLTIGWLKILCQRSIDHRCMGSYQELQVYSTNCLSLYIYHAVFNTIAL